MGQLAKWFLSGLALTVAAHPAAAATGCPALGVPSYFYRTETAEYDKILANSRASARVSIMIIGACNDERDTSVVCLSIGDPIYKEFQDLFARAKDRGIRPIGYITTKYGARPLEDIKTEIDLYMSRYKPAGFFLDEVKDSKDASTFAYYREISRHIRDGRGGYVALNPGVFPDDERVMWISDVVVSFESDYADYVSNYDKPSSWARKYPAARFWHLVHTVKTTAQMRKVLTLAQGRDAGIVYVTDVGAGPNDNTWGRLARYWSDEVNQILGDCRQ